jgi:hypothetical protein
MRKRCQETRGFLRKEESLGRRLPLIGGLPRRLRFCGAKSNRFVVVDGGELESFGARQDLIFAGHLMAANYQIFLVMDAGTPVAAFTARHEQKALLASSARRFHQRACLYVLGNQGPSIMTMLSAVAQ